MVASMLKVKTPGFPFEVNWLLDQSHAVEHKVHVLNDIHLQHPLPTYKTVSVTSHTIYDRQEIEN